MHISPHLVGFIAILSTAKYRTQTHKPTNINDMGDDRASYAYAAQNTTTGHTGTRMLLIRIRKPVRARLVFVRPASDVCCGRRANGHCKVPHTRTIETRIAWLDGQHLKTYDTLAHLGTTTTHAAYVCVDFANV